MNAEILVLVLYAVGSVCFLIGTLVQLAMKIS